MPKYRKGELNFYKTATPKELKKYMKSFPKNEKYVEQFLNEHLYNYVKKSWKKINPSLFGKDDE